MEQPSTLLQKYNSLVLDNDGIYRGAARRLGVPECTLWILYSLRTEEPPLTQTRLCQLLHQSKQTVNSALKKLESGGYINLVPGSDRRTRVVALTEKGDELASRTADRIIAAEESALAALNPQEQEAFLLLNKKYNDLLRHSFRDLGRGESL